MAIQILPARLANQIAAGEVVERPASVIKELVENSLDAGATKIHIDIDKGGAKKIRISDDGCGIAKEELSLALSRHATSKIKDLADLEAISSLGFRGEALASISSVARLTLTSKPANQDTAWQACASGRDMEVTIQPAAHPDGTTIEVNDLFFNTPARRKFMRTEKTEFAHIDEIVRRIALARFEVTFTLTHNGKMIRQYRAAKTAQQQSKRVAMVLGQKFIDNAIEIHCQHDNMQLSGWLATPNFYKPTNELCYSYVNGRMMRDKLINHAIRQAYADQLPSDGYPAFVLFLTVDFKEVDVNVHPAKHEVRFHQGRYVHDFIFSICQKALNENTANIPESAPLDTAYEDQSNAVFHSKNAITHNSDSESVQHNAYDGAYVKPLNFINEASTSAYQRAAGKSSSNYVSQTAANLYQQLMTPSVAATNSALTQISTKNNPTNSPNTTDNNAQAHRILSVTNDKYGVMLINNTVSLLQLHTFAICVNEKFIQHQWQSGLVSQPLLLPLTLSVSTEQKNQLNKLAECLTQAGIFIESKTNHKVLIRQFPALLRNKDIAQCFNDLLVDFDVNIQQHEMTEAFQLALAKMSTATQFTLISANQLLMQAQQVLGEEYNHHIHLNSVEVDLTSAISQLK